MIIILSIVYIFIPVNSFKIIQYRLSSILLYKIHHYKQVNIKFINDSGIFFGFDLIDKIELQIRYLPVDNSFVI